MPTTNLISAKPPCNSIITTPNAIFITLEIMSFYLNTSIQVNKQLWDNVSQDLIDQYNPHKKATSIFQYLESYVWLTTGRIASSGVVWTNMGVSKTKYAMILNMMTQLILFLLELDVFWIKCEGNEHTQHLLHAPPECYEILEDWTRNLNCRLIFDLDWQQVHHPK